MEYADHWTLIEQYAKPFIFIRRFVWKKRNEIGHTIWASFKLLYHVMNHERDFEKA